MEKMSTIYHHNSFNQPPKMGVTRNTNFHQRRSIKTEPTPIIHKPSIIQPPRITTKTTVNIQTRHPKVQLPQQIPPQIHLQAPSLQISELSTFTTGNSTGIPSSNSQEVSPSSSGAHTGNSSKNWESSENNSFGQKSVKSDSNSSSPKSGSKVECLKEKDGIGARVKKKLIDSGMFDENLKFEQKNVNKNTNKNTNKNMNKIASFKRSLKQRRSQSAQNLTTPENQSLDGSSRSSSAEMAEMFLYSLAWKKVNYLFFYSNRLELVANSFNHWLMWYASQKPRTGERHAKTLENLEKIISKK